MKKLASLFLALVLCLSLATPAFAANEYGFYAVEAGYSVTFFSSAYSERAVSVTGGSYEYLIPLNVSSGSTIEFGGMDDFAVPIPFYKANYDAQSGIITVLEQVPVEHTFDDYGCAMPCSVDAVFAAAESMEGNAVVIAGSSSRSDSLNSDIYNAYILLKLNGEAPKEVEWPGNPSQYAPFSVKLSDGSTLVFDEAMVNPSVFPWDGVMREVSLVTLKPGSMFNEEFTSLCMTKSYSHPGSYTDGATQTWSDVPVDKLFSYCDYFTISGQDMIFTLGSEQVKDHFANPNDQTVTYYSDTFTLTGISFKETRTISMRRSSGDDLVIQDATVCHIPSTGAVLSVVSEKYPSYESVSQLWLAGEGEDPNCYDGQGSGVLAYFEGEGLEQSIALTRPEYEYDNALYCVGSVYVEDAAIFFVFDDGEPVREKPFSDVKETDYFCDSVYAVADIGLIAGAGGNSFDPKGKLSWAHAITFAVRFDQYQKGEHIYGPDDQGVGKWYDIYVDYALENGMISERPASPNADITRADALNIFAKVFYAQPAINAVPEGFFTDISADHPAHDAIYYMARTGICNGMGAGKFQPDGNFTRGQAATLVARMAGLVVRAKI